MNEKEHDLKEKAPLSHTEAWIMALERISGGKVRIFHYMPDRPGVNGYFLANPGERGFYGTLVVLLNGHYTVVGIARMSPKENGFNRRRGAHIALSRLSYFLNGTRDFGPDKISTVLFQREADCFERLANKTQEANHENES